LPTGRVALMHAEVGDGRRVFRPALPVHGPVLPFCWWAREFPGDKGQVGQARGWLEELLPECEPLDDLVLLISELCTNAVVHTGSGKPGGQFGLTVEWTPRAVKALILDQGSLTIPAIAAKDDDAWADEFGRGLFLVDQLADYWATADIPDGRLVWLEMAWAANGGPLLQVPGGYQAAIGDAGVLRCRFPGTAIWWGHRSRSWWAALPGAVGEAGVIHAPTLDALSMVLTGAYPDFPPSQGRQLAMRADARPGTAACPLPGCDPSGRLGTASRLPGETPSPSPARHETSTR
jgi:anti-sigma regulatory factor (Ser/Thr protein kinase)